MSFELTGTERHSGIWVSLERHLHERRDVLRKENDGPHDAIKTAEIRGQIKALSALISLGKEPDKNIQ
jgi:hypothetical protein